MEKVKIKIYLINLKNILLDDILKTYSEYIKDEDIIKMNRFKFELNKKQSIVSSILKNKYVSGNIYYNEHGKPLSDDICFNVSHSDDYVTIALSKYPIGIDIEHIKDNVNSDLINYVCNIDEINDINIGEINKLFFYYWTRKEAVLKCKGIGISNNLKDVLKNNDYYLNSYYVDDYVYSIAIDYNVFKNIEVIKETKI